MNNPLRQLADFGQSFWYDNIRRELLLSGELARMVREDGLRGMTSNPTIFSKAVGEGGDYDATIRAYAGRPADQIFLELELEDIAGAADVLRPVYEQSAGGDGFVSIEVFPGLARDPRATIAQARLLWRRLGRPNVMVKVPATPECLPAIAALLEEGININITLMFGFDSYRAVVEAYLSALERRLAAGQPIARLASVASLFVSRVDTRIDRQLEALAAAEPARAGELRPLEGQAGIANARRMYAYFRSCYSGPRWSRLSAAGARPQRLLWASTSTKNPRYPDTLYAEALVGPDTVDTMPDVTVAAYRDHGNPADRLSPALHEAEPVFDRLQRAGIDMERELQALQDEGVGLFESSYQELIANIDKKRAALASGPPEPLVPAACSGPAPLLDAAAAAGQDMRQHGAPAALWEHRTDFWSGDAAVQATIALRLGWLHVVETMAAAANSLATFATECVRSGMRDAVLLGMGGSSLAPAVLGAVFGASPDGLRLHVLDTTVPEAIARVEAGIDLAHTLFLVSSKSGGTIEPNALFAYFWGKFEARSAPVDRPGRHFVAITDPGTSLARLAAAHGFRHIFINPADIGGRYSALSYFGLVPAALLGVDVPRLLERAAAMAEACRVADAANPGLQLGAALGAWARRGRDKLTLLTAPTLAPLGMWLEQLIAESTGKHNTGIVPVDGEPAAPPAAYGGDRVFVSLELSDGGDAAADLDALARQHPVVRLRLADHYDLGREFFRWEFATAIAGAVLGINPFDEPNVQESKDNTNRVLAAGSQRGAAAGPQPAPQAQAGGLGWFTPSGEGGDADALLRAWLEGVQAGDYIAIMAYLAPDAAVDAALRSLRVLLRDRLRVATTVGYGPRFLHSTGQLHKGGPATGVFLQLTAPAQPELPIPGEPFGFATLLAAQASGDFQSLAGHRRRLLRVDLAAGVAAGLAELNRRLEQALARMPAAPPSAGRAAD